MLDLIVQEARTRVGFPLKKKTRRQEIVIVIAPKVGSRSNWWTDGKMHSGMDSVEQTGVDTFLLCVDKVTLNNGQ